MACLRPIEVEPKSYCGTAKERTVVIADCRKCPPCRAKQARKWTTRIKDELIAMYDDLACDCPLCKNNNH
jgi:hypothetical protein